MADLIKNELEIRVSNTGIKSWSNNLELNQNSENNRLILLCEANYNFVEVFYTWPNGRTSYIHHMIPEGYNADKDAYVFHDDIPMAVTSFTIPDVNAQLRVSFTGYQKNDNGIVVPVSTNDTLINVIKVDNSAVIDQTYNGEDVPKIWTKLGELQNEMSNLDPNQVAGQIEELQKEVTNNKIEVDAKIATLPTFKDVYTKKEVDDKLSSVYTYKGTVTTKDDLPREGNKNGDAYTVLDEGVTYAWTGTEWTPIGNVSIDLSDYYDKTQINDITNALGDQINTNTTSIANTNTELTAFKASTGTKFKAVDAKLLELDTNKANKAEVYTKEEINNKFGTVYKFKGSVDSYDLLPTDNVNIGDVWNVKTDGMNYAWTGTAWDSLGTDLNLEDYATKVYVKQEIDNAIAGGDINLNNYYNKQDIDGQFATRDQSILNLTGRVGTNESNITKLDGNVKEIVTKINSMYQNDQLYTRDEINTKLDEKANDTRVTSEVNTLNTRISNEIKNVNATASTNLAAAKQYTDEQIVIVNKSIDDIKSSISGVYKYKGSVASYDKLPTEHETGDVWNVADTGNNYAWDGTQWDSLGAIINLEGYATKEEVTALDTKLSGDITAVESTANANASNITNLESTKANKDEVYTQSEINGKLETINTNISKKADANNVYTIAEADGKFLDKNTPIEVAKGLESVNKPNQVIKLTSDKSDNSVTYNMDTFRTKADSYSQTEINNKLADKANSKDVFTQAQTTEAINTAISNLVDSSPEALNTLNELAAALGDDPNFATTINNEIAKKANSADVYTQTKTNELLDLKANAADVYTKEDINGLGHLTFNDTISKANAVVDAKEPTINIKFTSSDKANTNQTFLIEDGTDIFNILSAFEPNKYSA